MEEALFRTMLFDSYGELLTEKQREYFDLHYNEDLSLAEIAQNEGVSRQSVWDIIRHADGHEHLNVLSAPQLQDALVRPECEYNVKHA